MKKLISFLLITVILTHSAAFFCHADLPSPPSVSAKSALLMEAESGMPLYEKNAGERMGMASTTKIMTALTVLSLCEPQDTVVIPKEAVGIEGSSVYLCEGEKMTVEELLYATLLSSANDAATALALYCSGSLETFSAEMNHLAKKIGAYDTHFVNPHGLYDEEHYTTAYDLALITREALNDTVLSRIFSTYKKALPFCGEADKRLAVNHNKLLKSYEGAVGVKTGFTKKTGRCLVSAATRDGMTLIAVTLNAPDDWRDHTAMLDFGFERYERRIIFDTGELCYDFPVSGGVADSVTLKNTLPITLVMEKTALTPKVKVYSCSRFIIAPALRGQVVANAEAVLGEQCSVSPLAVCEEISATDSIKQKGLFKKIAEFFK